MGISLYIVNQQTVVTDIVCSLNFFICTKSSDIDLVQYLPEIRYRFYRQTGFIAKVFSGIKLYT